MDFLEFSQERNDDTLSAIYYEKLPDSPEYSGIKFNYEYLDPFSKSFKISVLGSGLPK